MSEQNKTQSIYDLLNEQPEIPPKTPEEEYYNNCGAAGMCGKLLAVIDGTQSVESIYMGIHKKERELINKMMLAHDKMHAIKENNND